MPVSESQKTVLSLTASALFDAPLNISENIDWTAVKNEAIAQAVFPLIYKKSAPLLPTMEKAVWDTLYYRSIEKNMRVTAEHAEVGGLLEGSGISYVFLKGCASASYYPYPALRSMGDVDFLVAPDTLDSAEKVLNSSGFVVEGERDGLHIALKRKPNSSLEMHRRVNGIPTGKIGKVCEAFLSDIMSTCVPYQTDFGSFNIPDVFHHGLVLLLHIAAHLTHEGVGLRHLCDWAVFVSAFSDGEFCALFTEPLKLCGLWRFAQILTRLSEEYLSLRPHSWTRETDDTLLPMLMEDILSGGNFGTKEKGRNRQTKYIADRDNRTVNNKNVILQALYSIKSKAISENKSCFEVLADYSRLVVIGERKMDTIKTLRKAGHRKKLYSSFHLYELE